MQDHNILLYNKNRDSMSTSDTPVDTKQMSTLKKWRYIYKTCNPPSLENLDFISKLLLITRSCVFSLTYTSALIGGLLAATAANPNWLNFAIAVIGSVFAHAANNMMNDFFDMEGGVDDSEYARAMYAPHPILSGIISKGKFLIAIFIVNLIDLGILIYFYVETGPMVLVFALTGFFISLFYVAPPIRLKHIGLGEIGVLIVWGPLMIGGTYYVTAGDLPLWMWFAGLPYALLVMTVLVGKHVDKHDMDKAKGIHTLPVLLGTKRSLALNKFLMISFYPIVLALIAVNAVGVGILLSFVGLYRLFPALKTYSQPKPESAPEGWPVWPLWYVGWAFDHSKWAGGFFFLGLIINLFLPSYGVLSALI